jgi:hypothetical protein
MRALENRFAHPLSCFVFMRVLASPSMHTSSVPRESKKAPLRRHYLDLPQETSDIGSRKRTRDRIVGISAPG